LKKVLFLLVFTLTFSCFAQDSGNSELFLEVQTLIKRDLNGNMELIKSKSDKLTLVQKDYIYEEHSVSSVVPFILNFFTGFGLGSWIQGNTVGGIIGIVGVGSLTTASFIENTTIQGIGVGVFLGAWVTNLILPWTYAGSYNSSLEEALKMNGISSISIAPTLNIAKNSMLYPGASVSINF